MTRTPWIRAGSAVLAAMLLAACTASNAEKSNSETVATEVSSTSLTVAVESVRSESVADTIAATGSVAAWEEVVIGAEANGVALTVVSVDEGDPVKKGDVLARLDDTLLAAQIVQQEAAIEEAEANLKAAEEANARGQKLLQSSNVSKETIETRETAVRVTTAKLSAARAALNMLKVQSDRMRIVSPVDGFISKRSAVIGTVVQTGTELFRIVRDNRIEVAAKVAEQHLARIRAGQTVEVTDAAGNLSTGTVRAIAVTVDETTRLGTVHVALPLGTSLKPGMFARVAIATAAQTVLTVPEGAIIWRDGQAGVFTVATDATVAFRPIVTSTRADGRVAVVAGLAGGDRIVTAGAGFLADGNRVRIAVAETADDGRKSP